MLFYADNQNVKFYLYIFLFLSLLKLLKKSGIYYDEITVLFLN
jgi:hypothetical protein